jgi:hypothetical protein
MNNSSSTDSDLLAAILGELSCVQLSRPPRDGDLGKLLSAIDRALGTSTRQAAKHRPAPQGVVPGDAASRFQIGEAALDGDTLALHRARQQFADETIRRFMWVTSRVPKELRHYDLPFSAFEAVASLPHNEQIQWLNRAQKLGWSGNETRRQYRAAKEGGK